MHDWLTGMRGGEKCLEVFCDLFPQADIYTLIYIPGSVSKKIDSHSIHTSFLQKIPSIRKYYRHVLPLMPKAIESFQLEGYDLVISTSHCVAKGCRVPKGAIHLCYCFTPMRYVWDQFDSYFNNGRSGWVSSNLMQIIRTHLQRWDVESSKNVTHFVAISNFIRDRIQNYYQRESRVIYPPVDTDFYTPSPTPKNDYFLIVSALVPYKRVDLAVEAFNLSGQPLKIVGSGPLENKLKKRAKGNIEFLGWKEDTELKTLYQNCKALIFTSEEDFGIVPVEAMACGKPVIAYKKGGALETVLDQKTGLYFQEPTPQSLLDSIHRCSNTSWNSPLIRQHALTFGKDRFIEQIKDHLNEKLSIRIVIPAKAGI